MLIVPPVRSTGMDTQCNTPVATGAPFEWWVADFRALRKGLVKIQERVLKGLLKISFRSICKPKICDGRAPGKRISSGRAGLRLRTQSAHTARLLDPRRGSTTGAASHIIQEGTQIAALYAASTIL